MARTLLGMVAVFVSLGGLWADDRLVLKGPPPMTARASLDGGTVTIRAPVIGYEIKKKEDGGGTITEVVKEEVVRLDLKDLEAFDTRGRKVDAKALRDRLKAETHVLLSSRGPVDPYYLEVVKKGTLVLVIPFNKTPGVPERIAPGGDPADDIPPINIPPTNIPAAKPKGR
jgi:hypothetical protein